MKKERSPFYVPKYGHIWEVNVSEWAIVILII